MKVTPLNLHLYIPQKDVRKLIWKQLDILDRKMCLIAMNSKHKRRKDIFSQEAARRGYIELVEWLLKQGDTLGEYHLELACSGGHIKMAAWLMKMECPVNGSQDDDYTIAAAQGGHFEMFKWLRDLGFEISSETLRVAARCGHLKMLKCLGLSPFVDYSRFCDKVKAIARGATEGGHLNILKWLKGLDDLDLGNLSLAILSLEKGHLEIFHFFDEMIHVTRESIYICRELAIKGSIEGLKIARQLGFVWNSDVVLEAAEHGKFDAVKWLMENGCPYSQELGTMIRNTFPEGSYEHFTDWFYEFRKTNH